MLAVSSSRVVACGFLSGGGGRLCFAGCFSVVGFVVFVLCLCVVFPVVCVVWGGCVGGVGFCWCGGGVWMGGVGWFLLVWWWCLNGCGWLVCLFGGVV